MNLLLKNDSNELVKIVKNLSGFISPKGELFYVSKLEHTDWLIKHVPKFKKFEKKFINIYSNDWSTIYSIILDEAFKDGWIRISGERGVVGFRGIKTALLKHRSLINDIIMFIESNQKRPIQVFKEPV